MRAICGAIIMAGAMIGLGLAAIGFGIRYQNNMAVNPDTHAVYGAASMGVALVVLLCGLLIGCGVAFLGLMFHHERRHRELLRESSYGQPVRTAP